MKKKYHLHQAAPNKASNLVLCVYIHDFRVLIGFPCLSFRCRCDCDAALILRTLHADDQIIPRGRVETFNHASWSVAMHDLIFTSPASLELQSNLNLSTAYSASQICYFLLYFSIPENEHLGQSGVRLCLHHKMPGFLQQPGSV